MNIPSDPFILLGFVNMKLRDEYPSLDEMCMALGIERTSIEQQLSDAGFVYDASHNKFW